LREDRGGLSVRGYTLLDLEAYFLLMAIKEAGGRVRRKRLVSLMCLAKAFGVGMPMMFAYSRDARLHSPELEYLLLRLQNMIGAVKGVGFDEVEITPEGEELLYKLRGLARRDDVEILRKILKYVTDLDDNTMTALALLCHSKENGYLNKTIIAFVEDIIGPDKVNEVFGKAEELTRRIRS